MMNNWQYRILAVLLALSTWYVVTGREKVDAWVEIPVELTNAPRDMYISEGLLTRVDVRVRGPRSLVRGLDPKALAYPLDLSGLNPGENAIAFRPGNVPVSSALEIMEISPPRVNLNVEPLVERYVQVEAAWDAPLDPDYEFRRSTVRPAKVRLRGPESVVSRIESVPTATVFIEDAKPGLIRTKTGVIVDEVVEVEPQEVDVTLVFGVRRQDVWIKIPVAVAAPEGVNAVPRPDTVQLHVSSPVTLIKDDKIKELVKAEVRLEPEVEQINDVFAYNLELPGEVTLIKAVPERVEVLFKK